MKTVDPNLEKKPFGGKVVVLAGDFRQTLPVLKKASRAQILDAALTRADCWGKFTIFRLSENMRVANAIGDRSERIGGRNRCGGGGGAAAFARAPGACLGRAACEYCLYYYFCAGIGASTTTTAAGSSSGGGMGEVKLKVSAHEEEGGASAEVRHRGRRVGLAEPGPVPSGPV